MGPSAADHESKARERRRAALVFLAFAVLYAAKVALLRYLALDSVGRATGVMVDSAVVIGLALAVDTFYADHRTKALVAFDAVVSLAFLAIALYADFYGQLPTRAALAGAGQATTVGESVLALVRPVYALFFVDLAAMLVAWAAIRLYRRRASEAKDAESHVYAFQHRSAFLAFILMAAAFAAAVVAVRAMPSPIDGLGASSRNGMFAYLAAAASPPQTSDGLEFEDPESLQEEIDRLTGRVSEGKPLDGFEPGSARGSNVVVIQVEALQQAVIGLTVGGKEVTPTLNRLVRRSWYFPNTISQVGRGTTADCEFILNTSLYPSPYQASSLAYADREIPSLPRLLGQEGYETFTFHTNAAAYWNRSQLYPALGFTRYYDKKFFGSEEVIAFGSSDRVLFDEAFGELRARDASGTPFYAQMVTMSSHHPFTAIPKSERRLKLVPPYAGTTVGNYLVAIEYADRQIGRFIERLEAEGMLDNTIIVVTGDHFGLGDPENQSEREAQRALYGREYAALDRMRVPLIVMLPQQQRAMRSDAPAGQVDVMPSLTDALGLELDGVPHFGRSLFRSGPLLMPAGGFMPIGTYVDSRVLYAGGASFEEGSVTRVADTRPGTMGEASQAKSEAVRRLILMSDAYATGLPFRGGYDAEAAVVLPEE